MPIALHVEIRAHLVRRREVELREEQPTVAEPDLRRFAIAAADAPAPATEIDGPRRVDVASRRTGERNGGVAEPARKGHEYAFARQIMPTSDRRRIRLERTDTSEHRVAPFTVRS